MNDPKPIDYELDRLRRMKQDRDRLDREIETQEERVAALANEARKKGSTRYVPRGVVLQT